MTLSTLARAIGTLRPGAQWVLRGETWADIEWLDESQAKPTAAEVAAEVERLSGPQATDVRREASRRMQILVGARDADHLALLISNGVREQGRLQAIRTGIPGVIEAREWTPEEAARAAQLWAFDQAIEAIRAASNALEPNPPDDFADDARWPRLQA